MQEDWKENANQIYSGITSLEPLYPLSTDKSHRRFYYLKVTSSKNPWEVAAEIEALPQIDTCTPDLPMVTDVRSGHYQRWTNEHERLESLNDGTASWEESESGFKTKWLHAELVKDAIFRQEKQICTGNGILQR